MTILVDYTCASCGATAERWSTSPPVPVLPCHHCGAESRRRFAPIGLATGSAGPLSTTTGAAPDRRGGPTLCQQYPQIPGLCHMSESAGRMWVAKATGDRRGVDREQERQERAASQAVPTMDDVITHQHHGTSHSPLGPATTA